MSERKTKPKIRQMKWVRRTATVVLFKPLAGLKGRAEKAMVPFAYLYVRQNVPKLVPLSMSQFLEFITSPMSKYINI